MSKETINGKIFSDKIQTYKDAGLKQITFFESDLDFIQYTESGFIQWLIRNYEHTMLCGGSAFRFDILNPIK